MLLPLPKSTRLMLPCIRPCYVLRLNACFPSFIDYLLQFHHSLVTSHPSLAFPFGKGCYLMPSLGPFLWEGPGGCQRLLSPPGLFPLGRTRGQSQPSLLALPFTKGQGFITASLPFAFPFGKFGLFKSF